MKRKAAKKSVRSNNTSLVVFLVLFIIAMFVSVYAVLQRTSVDSKAYNPNKTITSCGQLCLPTNNTCPDSAPFCVQVKYNNPNHSIYRCSTRTAQLVCNLTTPYPTSILPSGTYPSIKITPKEPYPTCPIYQDGIVEMPCTMQ